jgi:hypothetical protein
VNLDEFTVSVDMSQLPAGLSAGDLFDHIRGNLPALTTGNPGTFSYYYPGEEYRWMSSAGVPNGPKGSYFSIDLPLHFSASVVVSTFIPGSSWTFSTVQTLQNSTHPVSGHRSFTWTESGGTGTLAIRGVDRVSDDWWGAANKVRNLLTAGDAVWRNFQQNLAGMLGPSAVMGAEETIYRPDWDELEAFILGDAAVEDFPACPA